MSSSRFADTPSDGYYAVIFTSQRTGGGDDYGEMAGRMTELAATQPGFLGMETARGQDGLGITVSYWASEDAIAGWKAHVEHAEAQRRGVIDWYERYEVRVARVERSYGSSPGV